MKKWPFGMLNAGGDKEDGEQDGEADERGFSIKQRDGIPTLHDNSAG